jgi:hypothetical protein
MCFQVVTNPIDLLKLQQKLKTDEYEDVEELATDVQLMVNNAKAFYKVTASSPLLTFSVYIHAHNLTHVRTQTHMHSTLTHAHTLCSN